MPEIGGKRYDIVIGTDVSRPGGQNGAYIEMRDLDANREVILFAFRSNASGKVTISMYRQAVPLDVMAHFLRIASAELSIDNWPLWAES